MCGNFDGRPFWPRILCRNDIVKLAKETGSIIFVGALDSLDVSEDITNEYNAVIAFFPDGTIEDSSYKKQHLVPFGEYMPMRDILTVVLPFMTELNMLEDDLRNTQRGA